MATKDLGKISITPKGTWTSQTTGVERNDIWRYGVSKFLALVDNPTVAPNDDGINWYQMSTAGESAYQEAVKLGFTGTEADWVQSLKQPAIDAAATANVAISQMDSRFSDKIDEVEASLKSTVDDAVATKAAKPLTISSDEVLAGSYNLDPNSGSIDIYEKTITLNNLPIIVGNTQEYVISDEPLGFGLFFSVDSFSVSSGKGLAKEFFQYNYQISRLYINDSMQSCAVIKCLNAPTEAVYGILHIKYCKFLGDVIEFDVTVPNTIDKSAINLEIPILKFNKKFLFSYITDDANSIFNYVFSGINKRFVAKTFINGNTPYTFHLGMEGVTGQWWNQYLTESYIPEHFLQCSDGAGLKRRFATTVAIWPNKWDGIDDNYDVGPQWPWNSTKEFKLFLDFGYMPAYHDLSDLNGATINQDNFNLWLSNDANRFKSHIGIIPKLMVEPNGDHSYLTYSQNSPIIQLMTAQGGVPLIQKVYPFKADFTLDKQSVAIQRIFDGNDDEVYKQSILSELANFNSASDKTTIYWYIGGSHRCSYWMTELFTQIATLYGDLGNDSIWVPTLDEMYEYTFMRQGTVWKKSITDTGVHFKMYVPKMPNFFFRDLSVLLSGISDITGVTVTSGNNVYGTSYAINNSKLLINLDFNPDLLSKVEKYVSDYEANYNANYKYDDAYYFVQKLKDGLKQPYLNRLNVYISPPVFTALTINGGAAATQNGTVTLAFIYTGQAPSYYIASENSDFSGASWQPYSSSVQFALSSGYVNKTIYVKLKNPYGESGTLSNSIMYNAPTLALSSISIQQGASTSNQAITIIPVYVGIPTQIMVSENSDFSGASWVAYSDGNVNYNLSSGYGSKTIYVKLKNDTTTTTVLFVSINYIDATSAILNGITINNGNSETDNGTVSVAIDTANTITKYKIGKQPDLSDCPNWITWVGSPVSFASGLSSGMLTVYVKVGNNNSESDIKSDTITITPDVVISAIVLNNGTSPLASLNVPVSFTVTSGTPTYYRLAESSDALNSSAWVAWSTGITYTFGSIGSKTLFGQVKNSVSTSQVFNAGITLTAPQVKIILANVPWSSSIPTPSISGVGVVQPIAGRTNAQDLKDTQGNKVGTFVGQYRTNNSADYAAMDSKHSVNNLTGSGSNAYWGTPTLPTATEYPNSMIWDGTTKNIVLPILQNFSAPATMRYPLIMKGLSQGNYKVRLLLSDNSSVPTTTQPWVYQVQDQTQQILQTDLPTKIINNNSNWLEFNPVTVDSDGYLYITQYWQTPPTTPAQTRISPMCIIEITKL